MKIKLLKKFRERFLFSRIHGYSEMYDRKTNHLYGPLDCSERVKESILEQLQDKGLAIILGYDFWSTQNNKRKLKRSKKYLREVINNGK